MSAERNELCPCGSGKKYKRCCLSKEEAEAQRGTWSYAARKALIESSADYPVDQCLINPNWQAMGQARIVVTRRHEEGFCIIGVYLVDTFCLGVKSAFCNAGIPADEIKDILSGYYLECTPQPISLDYAKAVIFGAVKYAKDLGFDPDPDFKLASCVLAGKEIEGHYHIPFGGPDGKPRYIQGPDDDVQAIMHQLSQSVGDGAFNYFLMDEDGETMSSFVG